MWSLCVHDAVSAQTPSLFCGTTPAPFPPGRKRKTPRTHTPNSGVMLDFQERFSSSGGIKMETKIGICFFFPHTSLVSPSEAELHVLEIQTKPKKGRKGINGQIFIFALQVSICLPFLQKYFSSSRIHRPWLLQDEATHRHSQTGPDVVEAEQRKLVLADISKNQENKQLRPLRRRRAAVRRSHVWCQSVVRTLKPAVTCVIALHLLPSVYTFV